VCSRLQYYSYFRRIYIYKCAYLRYKMTSDRGSCRRDVNPFADESRSCGGCPDLPGASSAAGQVVAVPLNCSGGIVAVVRTQSPIHQVPPLPIVYVLRTVPSSTAGEMSPSHKSVLRFSHSFRSVSRLHPPRHDNDIMLYYA